MWNEKNVMLKILVLKMAKNATFKVLYTNITELKNKEKDLERLSDAVNAMSSGAIIVWDQEQKLVLCQ